MAKSTSNKSRVRKSAPIAKTKVETVIVAKSKKRVPQFRGSSFKTVLGSVLKPVRVILRPLRFLIPRYFINAWKEVRQVVWPGRRDSLRLTLAVFIFATVFGLIVAVVDKGLDEFFKKVVLK